MAEPRDKQPPASIRHAMAALETLRAEDAALATTLEKSLPAYAMRLSQSGEAVDVDTLLAIARQGEEALKDAFAALRPAQDSLSLLEKYTRITAEIANRSRAISATPPDRETNPKAYYTFTLCTAAEAGDTETLQRMIALGANINSNMGEALSLAIAYGHTKAVVLLLEHGAITDKDKVTPAMFHAIKGGHSETVQLMCKHDPQIRLNKENFLNYAARYGRADIVALMLDFGARINYGFNQPLNTAAQLGYTDVVQLLLDRGADIHNDHDIALRTAACNGNTETVALLLDRGAYIDVDHHETFRHAASGGHTQTLALLLDRGANIHAANDSALRNAATQGHLDTVAFLLDHGARIAEVSLPIVAGQGHIETVMLLLERGAKLSTLNKENRTEIKLHKQHCQNWRRTVRMPPPLGLAAFDPASFRPPFFTATLSLVHREGYTGKVANIYAYMAMSLFQNDERLLQYLQKWGKAGKQPLHDLIHMIKLPQDLSDINLSAWGDALLQHGPKMALLVKYCDRIKTPLRSEDGKSWSYLRTRAEVAKYAYNRAAEHPRLAGLCFEHAVDEKDFNTALDIAQAVPPKVKDMPDITIDGKRFGLEGATFHKLANDDVRGLFLGELTDCCQSIGNAGSGCATHGYTSPNGGFYVIETAQGEIIGQSWAWRGEQSELCLDSLETLGARVSQQQWQDLLKEVTQELTTGKSHGVSALHVGMGGATPRSLSQHFEHAIAKPVDYGGYRDSKTQVRVWKR